MNKSILVVIFLSMVCVSSYAQKRTANGKKRTTRTLTKGRTATKKSKSAVGAVAMADTTKKAGAAKPMDTPVDGYYKKTDLLSAKATPYASVREADIMYAKRIWREIDVREKMNEYMSSPKARLIDILMDAIDQGELTAYDPTPSKKDPNGDSFLVPLTPERAKAKMADSVLVQHVDKVTGEKTNAEMHAGEFNPDSILKFRIKEDWIFDKQRSVYEPRIVGLAPLIKIKAGELVSDYQPAFWIYMPEARQILASKEVVMESNDASGLTYDAVFLKRIFTSYIVKQSNPKDERIKDYAQGIDKLYESERIKKSLLDYELNLWQY
jgi:gliding motility associated protien GldN